MRHLKIILATIMIFYFFRSFSQTTTILYDETSGLSTTKCNVFSPSVNVGGLLHTGVIGGATFSTTNGLTLPTKYTFQSGKKERTDYRIAYSFKSGYTYRIEITAFGTASNNTAYPSLGAALFTSGGVPPYTSTSCGPGYISGFPELGSVMIVQVNNTPTLYSPPGANFTSPYDYDYLVVEATSQAAEDISGTLCIQKIKIIETPPISFTLTSSANTISCGSTAPIDFTVNNVNNTPEVSNHTWNLGTDNGWLYNGSPAPQTISTGSTKTLTLTPVCGTLPKNFAVTVTAGGNSYNTNTSTISVNSPSMTISGNATLCSGSSVYTLNNVPCGASVVWNAYPASGIVSLAPQGNAVTVTRTGNGRVSLSATIDACNNFSVNKDIMVGGPTPSYGGLQPVTYYPQYCTGETYYFELLGATGDADQYLWNTYSPTQGSTQYIAYSDQSVPINFPGTGTNEIVVVGTNSCGSAVVASAFIGVSNCGGWGYWVAPNPGSGNIKISVNSRLTSNSKPNQAEIQIVEITDPRGVIKYRRQFKKGFKTVDVDVTQFINGIYTVRIFDGRQWQSGKIIVQH